MLSVSAMLNGYNTANYSLMLTLLLSLNPVHTQFAAFLTYNMKGAAPPCRSTKLSNDVDGPLWRVLVLEAPELWELFPQISKQIRVVVHSQKITLPVDLPETDLWRAKIGKILRTGKITRLASRSGLVEKNRFACRFWAECGTQLFMTSLLACWNDKLIYGYSALVNPLSVSSPLVAPATPSWPQLCRQRSFAHLARCFLSHWKSPTTHRWLQMLQDATVAQ